MNTSVIGCIPPVQVNTSVIGCYALYKARELPGKGREKDRPGNKQELVHRPVCVLVLRHLSRQGERDIWCRNLGTVSIFKNSKDTVKVEILILVEICSDLLIILRYI